LTPPRLREELRAAGLADVRILAVEGPGSFRDLDESLDDLTSREALLRAVRRLEREPTTMGASAHVMAIGRAV
jgi:DNA-binding Lrp family transcriptional regulator